MFCQSQAFPTEKKPDFVWRFLIFKKAKCVKKCQNFNIWLQKAKLAAINLLYCSANQRKLQLLRPGNKLQIRRSIH